ncbi:MAG: TasA family protein [Bacillota bacterium]
MKKKLLLVVVFLISVSIMSGGLTLALFSARTPATGNTFRAATVGLSAVGELDFDSQTLNLAPGEIPEAHVDSITLDSSVSTIATKLYVTFSIVDMQLGPPYPVDRYSLAEGLVIDRIEYKHGGATTTIAPGITTFDELVNNGIREATYYLGDVPANDTTSKQLVFKWHFPDNGADDNKYQGAGFRLNYYFTAEQAQ